MFEKEIEFIYNYNLNKIQHLGSFISYEQLISTDIHPALLQYVSAEIDFLIYEDRQKLLKDSLFDYSGEKIIAHFTNIGEEIKKSKKFSLEYLTKLLLHASSFNVNYIIRPKWSLLQFVFESENEHSKSVVEVKQILNYLHYYPYLKRLLISFFNKKRILTITLSELEELLDKIDKINYESNFDRVFDGALKNMVEFINMGESRNNKISKQSVELFLEDKNLSEYKIILTEKFGVNGSSKYEISDFKNVILDYSIEEDTTNSSEDKIVSQKLEELKKGVDEYEKELNEDEPLNTDESETENKIESIEVEENLEIVKKIEEDDLLNDEGMEKKSFLESHIDGLDGEILESTESKHKTENEIIDSDLEEIEPPDFDEAPRVDEKNIDEAYEFAVEEEELDALLDEDTELERVEIIEEEGDPFDDNEKPETVFKEDTEDSTANRLEVESDGFVELGNSVTFSSEQLTTDDADDWPTKSSNQIVSSEIDNEGNIDDSETSDILKEINDIGSKVEEEQDIYSKDSIDEEVVEDEKEVGEEGSESDIKDSDSFDEKLIDKNDTNFQEVLFAENDFEDDKEEPKKMEEADEEILIPDESISNEEAEVASSYSIDISVLLENKKIAKIIEVVFDYDMEEFSDAIDRISECNSEVEALATIDDIAKSLFVDGSTREIKVLKNIISDFFK